LPIILEVIESTECIEQILPRLDEMVDGGLITHRKKSASSLPPRQEVVAPLRATELLTPAFAFQAGICCRILLAFHLTLRGEVGVNQFGDRARYTLAILFAINLLNFYDRQIPGALVEPIRKQWALTDSQIGCWRPPSLSSTRWSAFRSDRLSDRWNVRGCSAWALAAWSLLTAASGLAWGYGSLFAARLGVGVGEATCAPTRRNSLIGDLYPSGNGAPGPFRSSCWAAIGNFLGSFVSGHVAAAYGWRMAFYVACLPGLLLAVLAMRVFDPPPRRFRERAAGGTATAWLALLSVLKIPTIRGIIITGACLISTCTLIPTFLPAYISAAFLPQSQGSEYTCSITFGLAGIPGLLLGGWAGDRVCCDSLQRAPFAFLSVAVSRGIFIFLAFNRLPGAVASLRYFMDWAACSVILTIPVLCHHP